MKLKGEPKADFVEFLFECYEHLVTEEMVLRSSMEFTIESDIGQAWLEFDECCG